MTEDGTTPSGEKCGARWPCVKVKRGGAGSLWLSIWRPGGRRRQSIRWMDWHPRQWYRVAWWFDRHGVCGGVKPVHTIHQGPLAMTDADIIEGVYDPEIAIPGLRGRTGRGMRPW